LRTNVYLLILQGRGELRISQGITLMAVAFTGEFAQGCRLLLWVDNDMPSLVSNLLRTKAVRHTFLVGRKEGLGKV
jgi:hypothetical protein